MQQVGGSVGTALFNTIAASAAATYAATHLSEAKPLRLASGAVHSYTVAFWIAAGVFLGGAIVTALVLRPGVAQAEPYADADAAPATDSDTERAAAAV